MPQDYVYVPTWLLILLVFLASGCVQYALIGAVKLAMRWTRERPRVEQPASSKVITLADIKREQQG